MPALLLPVLFVAVGVPALLCDLRTRTVPLYLSMAALHIGIAHAFASQIWVLGLVIGFVFMVANIPIAEQRYRGLQIIAVGLCLLLVFAHPTTTVGVVLAVTAVLFWLLKAWGGADAMFMLGLAGLFPTLAFVMLFVLFWAVFVVLYFIAVRQQQIAAAIGYLFKRQWHALQTVLDTPAVQFPMLVPLVGSAMVYLSLQLLFLYRSF